MKPQLTESTYAEMASVFDDLIAGGPRQAMITFTGDAPMIVPVDNAIKVLDLLSGAQPTKPPHTVYRSNPFALPSMRILTTHEHKVQWLANHFDAPTSDIEAYCKYDPSTEARKEHQVDFAYPQLDTPAVDDDLTVVIGTPNGV